MAIVRGLLRGSLRKIKITWFVSDKVNRGIISEVSPA